MIACANNLYKLQSGKWHSILHDITQSNHPAPHFALNVTPPMMYDSSLDTQTNNMTLVVINVCTRQHLARLSTDDNSVPAATKKQLSIAIIAGLVVGVSISVIVLIILIVCCIKHMNRRGASVKRMLIQPNGNGYKWKVDGFL